MTCIQFSDGYVIGVLRSKLRYSVYSPHILSNSCNQAPVRSNAKSNANLLY